MWKVVGLSIDWWVHASLHYLFTNEPSLLIGSNKARHSSLNESFPNFVLEGNMVVLLCGVSNHCMLNRPFEKILQGDILELIFCSSIARILSCLGCEQMRRSGMRIYLCLGLPTKGDSKKKEFLDSLILNPYVFSLRRISNYSLEVLTHSSFWINNSFYFVILIRQIINNYSNQGDFLDLIWSKELFSLVKITLIIKNIWRENIRLIQNKASVVALAHWLIGRLIIVW